MRIKKDDTVIVLAGKDKGKTGKVLKVTPAKYKAEFPWLKEVDSLALCNAQLHLQTAYKNFFRDSSVGFPKFKSKKNPVRSYTTNCVNGNITLQNGKVKLPKAGWIRIKQHRSIDDSYILKGATVTSIMYHYYMRQKNRNMKSGQ